MRALMLTACLMGMALSAICQEPVALSQEELKYKICPFDKEADAVIFCHKAVATPDGDGKLVTRHKIRFKILRDKGIDRGNVIIPFYSKDGFEAIEEVGGFVYNTEGDPAFIQLPIDRKTIFRNKLNEVFSEVKLALPHIRVGSIIEYEFTSIRKTYYLSDWNFQSDIPTLWSQFDVTILAGAQFAYKISKSPLLPVDVKTVKEEGRMIFTMRNIGGLREEPFMDAPDDYRQKIVFQFAQYQDAYGARQRYANTWADLARDLLSSAEFGKALDRNVNDADAVLAPIKLLPSEYEKMVATYAHIRKNFSWNRIYSTSASDGLKKVWDRKSGSAGEINLLLINLLREVKLDVIPLLVSDRDNGKVDASYPFINQFNKVVALVSINGRKYLLDGTDAFTPVSLIPFNLLNTYAFPVVKKSAELILLGDDKRMHTNYLSILSTIDERGEMKGEANMLSFDYSKANRRSILRQSSSIDKFVSHFFQREVSNIEIDSFQVDDPEIDSLPMRQSFQFATSMPSSGDYRIVTTNLFAGFDKSPFVSDLRFTNINFGSLFNSTTTHVVNIPATMKPEALPKNINLLMPDKTIGLMRTVVYDADRNQVIVRTRYQLGRPVFVPDEYDSVKEFYKKMVEAMNEPIVLTKK
jgi:hypothetical protein